MTESSLRRTFQNKRILITGGTGSIGIGLVKRLLEFNPKVIRIFSNDEAAQFELEQELIGNTNLRFLVGDVRDKERLKRAMEDIDMVFHAAALKHVPLCEYNPFEAIKTNVIGTQNLLDVAIGENIEKLITISTDKAANPVNVMGATKLLAERLTIAANYYKGSKRTIFSCVRFGNVLGSRGSVLQLFQKQIRDGGPVTLTHPNMVRFVMSIDRAINLVLRATKIAKGGEIFIFKMSALHIKDLIDVMIQQLAPRYGLDSEEVEVKLIGIRTGEKLYEELMTESEATIAYEIDDMIVVQPQITAVQTKGQHLKKTKLKTYTAKDAPRLTISEIRNLLELTLK